MTWHSIALWNPAFPRACGDERGRIRAISGIRHGNPSHIFGGDYGR